MFFFDRYGAKLHNKILSLYHDDLVKFKDDESKLYFIIEELNMNKFQIYCLLRYFGVNEHNMFNSVIVHLFIYELSLNSQESEV